jgi:DNA-binding Lrp family transcriptional regulator
VPIRKDGKKTLHKGDVKRRKVALLHANDQPTAAIAAQVGLSIRRVQDILKEPVTQEMVERFRPGVEQQRLAAEGTLLEVLVDKLQTEEWVTAAVQLEQRISNAESVRAQIIKAKFDAERESRPGNQVNLQINQPPPVTLEDLLRPHRPAGDDDALN